MIDVIQRYEKIKLLTNIDLYSIYKYFTVLKENKFKIVKPFSIKRYKHMHILLQMLTIQSDVPAVPCIYNPYNVHDLSPRLENFLHSTFYV